MSRERHYGVNPKFLIEMNQRALKLANQIHTAEEKLVQMLLKIDQDRIYVRFGHKSLRGYCTHGLQFTRTQSQRIVTAVRRYETTSKIEHEDSSTFLDESIKFSSDLLIEN